MGNPLVVQAENSTKAYSGVPLLESAFDTANAIESGDWAAGVLGVVGTAMGAVEVVLDPFGAIISAGVGWLMEHVEPLKEALDSLAGNPDEVKAHAQTWQNIATELGSVSEELKAMVTSDTANWTGPGADAYRARGEDTAALIAAAQTAASGASDGIGTAGEVVSAVRTTVRDIIADVVGSLASWAAQVLFTFGIGLTWVVPKVIEKVASTAMKIAKLVKKLIDAMRKLGPLLGKLGRTFADAAKGLKGIKGGKAPETKPVDGGKTSASGHHDGGKTSASGHHDGGSSSTSGHDTGSRGLDGGKGGPGGQDMGPVTHSPGGSAGGGGTHGPKGTRPSMHDHAKPPQAHDNPTGNRPNCGDPIDVTTGWMMLTQTDVDLDSTLPLVLSRTHLSSYRLGRSFGRSWASTVDQRLEAGEAGIAFAVEDGTILFYPVPQDGDEVLPESGPRWPLRRTADGGFAVLLTEREQILHFSGEGSLIAIVDGNGRRIDFRYGDKGLLTGIDHSGGYRIRVEHHGDLITGFWLRRQGNDIMLAEYRYDDAGRLSEVVNTSGQPLRFSYDDAGRITGWEDRNGMWYRYEYDSRDRCVRAEGAGGHLAYELEYGERVTRATNSLGQTTEYHLNDRFQVVREVNPLGHVTLFEWDTSHRLLSRTDPLGRTTRYRYDERGNIVAATYPDGSQSLTEYGENGRPVTIVEPDGAVWKREYSAAGSLTAVIDPTGARTTYDYDALGNLRTVTDPAGGVTTYEVNLAGLVTAVTDPSGARTSYGYDELGRCRRIVDPLGGETLFFWTPEGLLTDRIAADGSRSSRRYDGEGNLRQLLEADGGLRSVEIGAFDVPSAEIRPDGSRLEFAYDTELRLVSVTNEQGKVWRYSYDAAGNLVSERDFDGREVRYAYDPAGQLIERTNAAGQTVRYTRDVRGRVVARTQSGPGVSGQTTVISYDPAGRIVTARTPDAELTVTYDPCGRVLAETVNGRTLTSRYDGLGRRTGRRTPSGAISAWEYGAGQHPIALHTAGRTMRFQYDAAGREVERRIADDVTLTQVWDAADRLRSQTVLAGRQRALVQHRAYDYHSGGAPSSIVDHLGGVRTFELDSVGRVTAVRGDHGAETYSYDPAGNVLHAAAPAVSSSVDGAGPREYRGTLLARAGNVRYEHDAEGRVVLREVERPGGRRETWRFGWDAEDRLVWTQTPDGRFWRYGYDALGRRVWKRLAARDGATLEQTDFTWDGATLAEQVHNGAVATVWEWAPWDTHRVLSQAVRVNAGRGWTDRQFHGIVTDATGTPAELVDATGRLSWRAAFTLWGAGSAVAGTPLRFPGQYHDAETGLYYNLNRYYDPAAGQYISHDPLGLDPAPNSRAYVLNPTAATDPLGLMPCAKPVNTQGHYPGGKTHALTGYDVYQSGWTSHGARFDNVPPQTVMNNSSTPFRPHTFDQGTPGQYNASHAEIQAYNAQPGNPIVVSRPMCNSCQEQFQDYANQSGKVTHVGSPSGIHQFTPGGAHQNSLMQNPQSGVSGYDAQGNPYKMIKHPDGSIQLATLRPGGEVTTSTVRPDWSAEQKYLGQDGVESKATYYPDKNTDIETQDPANNLGATTHVGPSGSGYDLFDDGTKSKFKHDELGGR